MTKCVLCVDDRPEMIEMAKDILEYGGYSVLTRITPYHDTSEIEALHPDLVIVTRLNFLGRETLALLKLTTIPVLVLYREPYYYFTEQDQELMNKHPTIVLKRWDLDANDLLKIVGEVLSSHKPDH